MKKITGCLLTALIAFTTLTIGCSNNSTQEPQSTEKKLTVYASFYTMYDFALKIGGDKAAVGCLVPSGTEPHDWEPSAGDMQQLEKADILVYNGLSMEHWIDKVAATLDNDIMLVNSSENVNVIETQDGTSADMHIWLSIKNAKIQLENIKNAFCQADPNNAEYYSNNYNEYAKKFDELDQKYSQTLEGLENKNIVVSHEAFSYLCRDYGLTQIPIQSPSADTEPEAGKIAEIIKLINDNNIKYIYYEELVNSKAAEIIAQETGAQLKILSPIEGLTAEEAAAGDDYLSIMEKNLTALSEQ